jgi:hypothetical protein
LQKYQNGYKNPHKGPLFTLSFVDPKYGREISPSAPACSPRATTLDISRQQDILNLLTTLDKQIQGAYLHLMPPPTPHPTKTRGGSKNKPT